MKRPQRRKIRRQRSRDRKTPVAATLEIGAELASKPADNARIVYTIPGSFTKDMAIIATSTWKARCRMIDPASGEVREEMKRVCGDIERIERCLNGLGIVVEDHTDKPFDYGLPWRVIATKPIPGITKEVVTETLKPTVRWNEQIIQHAEVEIGTPTDKQETHDENHD